MLKIREEFVKKCYKERYLNDAGYTEELNNAIKRAVTTHAWKTKAINIADYISKDIDITYNGVIYNKLMNLSDRFIEEKEIEERTFSPFTRLCLNCIYYKYCTSGCVKSKIKKRKIEINYKNNNIDVNISFIDNKMYFNILIEKDQFNINNNGGHLNIGGISFMKDDDFEGSLEELNFINYKFMVNTIKYLDSFPNFLIFLIPEIDNLLTISKTER
jgi:radical SAM protein with 4Fe4S-binding SPASM domain